MPEAEQTVGGDYEYISYYTFDAVDYDRPMSWKEDKSHNGRIGVIENGEIILNYGNKTGKEDVDLLAPSNREPVAPAAEAPDALRERLMGGSSFIERLPHKKMC
ncbi:hypothetical protein CJF32_00010404 [Rutstroemia sp. NJR-2017a WRK4]|nr:hypothetical protein CJF32_00010404 [Rutstroemia sp. NJR-2017a WRK4]